MKIEIFYNSFKFFILCNVLLAILLYCNHFDLKYNNGKDFMSISRKFYAKY